jgi:hypothetical protein
MIPRQARLPPTGTDAARVSPKNRKILAIYSCKNRGEQIKICLSLAVRHSTIKS